MMTAGENALFGALLRRWRQAAGPTQEELAERAGLSRRGINGLVRQSHRAGLTLGAVQQDLLSLWLGGCGPDAGRSHRHLPQP
jgi:DNA-binding XRE family transcriptional regulator